MYKPITTVRLIKGGNIIKQGHDFTLEFNLFDGEDALVDLTGSAVAFKIAQRAGGVVHVGTAQILGVGHIGITVNEDVGYGDRMRVEFTSTKGGVSHKFPADDFVRLQITPSLDNIGTTGVNTITVEQFQRQYDALATKITNTADTALTKADTAVTMADSAVTKADGSASIANEAVIKAKNAEEVAGAAESTANIAKDIAEVSQKQVKQVIDGEIETGVLRTNIDEKLANLETEYAPKLTSVESQLAEKATQLELEIERARISNLTAHAGDTDGNAELLDIRVGFDGITYATAGEATRAIGNYMTAEKESWVI